MSLTQSCDVETSAHAKPKSDRLGLRGENLEKGSCRGIKNSQLKTWYAIWGQRMKELGVVANSRADLHLDLDFLI